MYEAYIIIMVAIASYASGVILTLNDIKFDSGLLKSLVFILVFALAAIWPVVVTYFGYTFYSLNKERLQSYFQYAKIYLIEKFELTKGYIKCKLM
jgi:ribosome biogenesis protein Tsr3